MEKAKTEGVAGMSTDNGNVNCLLDLSADVRSNYDTFLETQGGIGGKKARSFLVWHKKIIEPVP